MFQQRLLNEETDDFSHNDIRQTIKDRNSIESSKETVCDLFAMITEIKCPSCHVKMKPLLSEQSVEEITRLYHCEKCCATVHVKIPPDLIKISFSQRTKVWSVVRVGNMEQLLTGPCINIFAKITESSKEPEVIIARVYQFTNNRLVTEYWDDRAKEDLKVLNAIHTAQNMINNR